MDMVVGPNGLEFEEDLPDLPADSMRSKQFYFSMLGQVVTYPTLIYKDITPQ